MAGPTVRALVYSRRWRPSQEQIVALTAAALFVVFAVTAPGFLHVENIISLLKNVAILGVLALAMAVVVIGRGIDLSIVPTMVVSVAFLITLRNDGLALPFAFGAGFLLALAIGSIQGVLIAYADVPAIFVTLAMGVAVYGFGLLFLITQDVSYLPASDRLIREIGSARFVGMPSLVLIFFALAVLFHLGLRFTQFGRFIYAMGDNPAAARLAGISVRVVTVIQYALSAVTAFAAGLMIAASVSSMSMRIVNSTMIYDILLIVVIGGIGLSGGKGGVRNVIVGTVLIGILINGMTLLNVPYTAQNIVKGCVLLLAIIIDAVLNPRDEQTSKQGDI
jgi:ribose transport system permease protein